MSKKTHKKASKPKAKTKAKTKAGTKAKASAKKTVSTTAKVRAKAKTKSPATGARKAAAVKKTRSERALPTAKSSSNAKPVIKAAPKASVETKTRVSIREAAEPKAVKPVSTEPTHAEATPQRKTTGLVVGSKVPAFQLPRDGGAMVSLESFAGRKLVMFFYPRASTPGCTKEAMDFSRLSGAFAALKTDVLGISADPQRAQETFRDKHDLTVPLLSDEAHTVLEAFGVWGDKSLYGKIFQGIIRTTVLIGTDGRVINIWRNVKVDGHADAVLNYVENL